MQVRTTPQTNTEGFRMNTPLVTPMSHICSRAPHNGGGERTVGKEPTRMRSTFFANSPEVQAAELPWVDRGKHDNNECPLAWLPLATAALVGLWVARVARSQEIEARAVKGTAPPIVEPAYP
jgi:hypothetical protein